MRGSGERGQATVEWIGLMLGLALAFGGALGVARGAHFGGEAGELGEALAQRMTCGVRGACAAGAGGAGPRAQPLREHPLRERPRRARPLRKRPSPGAFLGRGSPPWAPSGRPWSLKGAGPGVLRLLGKAGRVAWPVCLGIRRLRYELDHPRTPRQGIPIQDTLGEVNQCLNPLAFLVP